MSRINGYYQEFNAPAYQALNREMYRPRLSSFISKVLAGEQTQRVKGK